ncbi:MAG: carboxypeptidase-like regulatory domain-containing protein, partial [Dehalococcoidia bacterium]|nr:carboxypeptidase-like regulatory domain-containing protein [Dehalococcoidia bacterium]
ESIRHGDFFVKDFISQIARGKTVKKAYELAAEKVAEYTENENGNSLNGASAGSGQYFDESAQHPLLEDNGDGTGTFKTLSSTAGKDGAYSADIVVGSGSQTSSLEITKVSDAMTLEAEDEDISLTAEVNDNELVDKIWVEVVSPGHTLKKNKDETEQQTIDLPRFNYNELSGLVYTWNDFTGYKGFYNFEDTGSYRVLYFAREKEMETIAPFMSSEVYRNTKGNVPPTAFNPVYPAKGTETAVALTFEWEESFDPDTDENVTYTLTIGKDSSFETIQYRQKNNTNTFAVVDKKASLKDATTYYWKVLASDVDGGTTLMGTETVSGEISDQTSPMEGTAEIYGHVKDEYLVPVMEAEVALHHILSDYGRKAVSDAAGFYEFMHLEAGKYTLTASKGTDTRHTETLELNIGEIKKHDLIIEKDVFTEMTPQSDGTDSGDGADKIASAKESDTVSSFTASLSNGYPGFIKGIIYDEESMAGLHKAEVTAKGMDGSYRTTETGSYFMQFDSGDYTVSGDASGYVKTSKKTTVEALGTVAADIGLPLDTKSAGIVGQVTDKKTGNTIEGVTVTVKKKGFKETTTTDSGGNYSFTGLEAGKYKLIAKKSKYKKYQKAKLKLEANKEKTVNIKMKSKK